MRATAASLLLAALAASAPAAAQVLDTASRVEFDVRTRIGSLVRGRFPRFEGRVETLPDGRRQVRLRLSTAAVVVDGAARNTTLARGPALFDAARHPWIEFVSEPYPEDLARRGGALRGRLRMRGVERTEAFMLAPTPCARPGHDCPVLAQGRVSRDHYGLKGWRWMLADRVRFRLHVRFAES